MGIRGDDDREGVGDDAKLDGQGARGFAIHLGINLRVGVRGARGLRRFPGVNSWHAMEHTQPNCRQIRGQQEAAAAFVGDDFEFIVEEAGARGDAKWAAVIFGAPDDDEAGGHLLFRRRDMEAGKRIGEELAKAFEPVGQNADAKLALDFYAVNDGAVGACARDAEEITFRGESGALLRRIF